MLVTLAKPSVGQVINGRKNNQACTLRVTSSYRSRGTSRSRLWLLCTRRWCRLRKSVSTTWTAWRCPDPRRSCPRRWTTSSRRRPTWRFWSRKRVWPIGWTSARQNCRRRPSKIIAKGRYRSKSNWWNWSPVWTRSYSFRRSRKFWIPERPAKLARWGSKDSFFHDFSSSWQYSYDHDY